jgi:hypothetical protein
MTTVTTAKAPSSTPLARILESEGSQATYPFESAVHDDDSAGSYLFESTV